MGASIIKAMRSFVGWASSRPYRLVLLTIVFVHILAPLSAGLLVVDALRRGPRAAMLSAIAAILGVSALGLIVGANLVDTLSLTAPILLGGAASGALLSWSRSLSLAFQGTIIGGIVVSFVLFGAFPEVSQLGQMLQDEALSLLEAGGASPAQLDQFASVDPIELVRVLLILSLASLVAALMLGYWWYALIGEGVRFGPDFRALKLGRVAGIVLMTLIVADLFLDAELIQNVAPMAVIGFLFQGLSVLHARAHNDKWPRAVIVLIYFTFVPWTYVALMGLSAIGLVDNFFDLRARPRT